VIAATVTLALAGTLAVVTQDNTSLRAAASDNAAQQAQLAQGDLLEVRGQRLDHLQVWDHRRERAGYVRATQVQPLATTPQQAPQLLAVLRFLRDQPGQEALGIAYVAAYLKAVPAADLNAEPFAALGQMAERLAQRASRAQGAASHLDVAATYGVRFNSIEMDRAVRACYEGQAWRQVLAMPANPEQRLQAVLGLTRPACVSPTLNPRQRRETLQQHASWLGRVSDADLAALTATQRNRLHLRRAGVWAQLAFEQVRAEGAAPATARHAVDQLAAVQRDALADDDRAEAQEAALQVAASRWAAEPAVQQLDHRQLRLSTEPGEPGQRCLVLHHTSGGSELLRRCTHGVVWLNSARLSSAGDAAAVAVQPLPGWRELWVLRRQAGGWVVQVLPPAPADPVLGTIEFAGFVPGAPKLLVAREAREGQAGGRTNKRFEVLQLDTLAVDKSASDPALLALFNRWQDAAWKRTTVLLR
jgi:hypothetical protein